MGARTGAEDLVAALAGAGVGHVFGLPGTTIMDILDALACQDTIRYITVRHEQVAAFMADGYARASGQVGVCLASRGPGAANMAIGVHNAHAESIPVLVVVGQVGDDIAARHAFEETDLLTMFAPMTKWAVEVHDTARIRELAVRAVRTAAAGRPGPVLLSLPLDVQQRVLSPADAPQDGAPGPGTAAPPGGEQLPRAERLSGAEQAPAGEQLPDGRPAGRIYRPGADPEGAAHAARLLAAAARPVLIVGGGVTGDRAHAAVRALAVASGAPVVTTWLRKSRFPNDDPHYAGVLGYGAHPAAEAAVRGADLIVALGCRFSEFTSRRWTLVPPGTAVIQVDVDADEIGRTVPVTVGLQADAALAAESIHRFLPPLPTAPGQAAMPGQADPPDREAWRRDLRSRYEAESRLPGDPDAGEHAGPPAQPVPSAALVAELQGAVDRHQALLVQDVHTFGPWIARYLQIREPGSYFAAAGGSMGWGLPAALGIQVARPERRVIAVLGDGSFWMVAQDLETAVRERLPVVCVVVNNFAYGNTRDRQRIAHGGRYLGVFYGNPDFGEFARLLGAHGERVEKSGDLAGAIDRAVASGKPAVIDVIQDAHEGLPPGMQPPAARPS